MIKKGRGLGRGLQQLAPELGKEKVNIKIPRAICISEETSIAEASYHHSTSLPMIADIVAGAYFDFNRLYVPLNTRNCGVGTRLLRELQARINTLGLPLINRIHPYANSVVSYDEITKWYVKRGFKRTQHEGILVYWPTGN